MENYEESLGRCVDLVDRKDITQFLSQETLSFLTKLDNVWNEIGIDTEDRKQRGFRVIEHVKSLFDDMLKEANDYKMSLAKSIESLLEELSRLGKELGIDIAIEVNGYERMSLNTVNHNLQEKILKYKNMHTAILSDINELHEQAEVVFYRLGLEDKFMNTSPVPTHKEIEAFKIYINDMRKELQKRENIFNMTKIEIIKIIKDLQIKPSLEFEKTVLKESESTFKLSDENMKLLENWCCSLKHQQKETHSKINDLREKISMYCARLEKSPERKTERLKSSTGNSITIYLALKEEEAHWKEEIKRNIKLIVDKMRQEIITWWEQCYYSEEQKKEFIHFDSDCFTEDLLTLHEIYIDKLKTHFNKNKAIYDLLSQRTEMWNRLLELEERAINPDRLKNRGGQLLREEKERNSVRARLPKIENKLINIIEQYETENNKPFTISSTVFSEMIQNDKEQFKENRHNQLSAKKQARENCKTPMKSPARVGMPQVRTPITPRISPKRKMGVALFSTPSAKKTKSSAKKIIPKLQINGSTLNKRASLERRKRLERKRNSGKNGRRSKSTNTTDYDNFELDLDNKTPACRSTLGTELENNNAGPSGLQRTPSRANLKTKSPSNAANRLTPAPGNFPIII